jgi:hypothetical protein
MRPDQFGDLAVFTAIASDRSFTRAAKRLGVTQSALSQTMKRLDVEPQQVVPVETEATDWCF